MECERWDRSQISQRRARRAVCWSARSNGTRKILQHIAANLWIYWIWIYPSAYLYGYGSIPIDTFLVGWTSIYQLFWGSLGTRVLTHPHIYLYIYILILWSIPSGFLVRRVVQACKISSSYILIVAGQCWWRMPLKTLVIPMKSTISMVKPMVKPPFLPIKWSCFITFP